MNITEKHISQIKKEETIEKKTKVIFNTTHEGSNESSSSEYNKFKELFEKGNKLNKLVDSFKFLNSLPSLSPLQKNILNNISISICRLLKNQKPPESYNIIISYITPLRLSPHPPSGYDYPKAAQIAWDKIIKD
jgi:hypothetical protein